MAQNVVDFSDNPTGAELMDDYLDKEQQNVLTSNSGLQRPSYAEEGTVWLDKTSSPWLYKMFDGTDDIIIGQFDADNNRFIPSDPMTTAGDLIVEGEDGNPIRLAPGTAGTVLTANGAGALPTYQVNPIGVLTYSSSYTYKKKDIVVNTNEDDETALYKSLVDSNIGNALTDDTKWEKLSLGGGGNDNIGDIQYTTRTDVPNGGAWCDGEEYTQAMFPDIYQMLVDGKLNSTDFTTFDSSVSTNGSCGMFALDTATTSFKVPLLKDVYIKAGDTPLAFGAESLPNITGKFGAFGTWGSAASTMTGALSESTSGYQGGIATAGSPFYTNNLDFKASNSSSTYQDRAKVNPDHITLRAYVVLYASAAEASEAQAQEFMTALGGKANTDLSNVSSNIDYIVESGTTNGITWEKYRSGRLKQRGFLTVDNTSVTTGSFSNPRLFTLPKAYANKNYGVLMTLMEGPATVFFQVRDTSAQVVDETSFKLNIDKNVIKWYFESDGMGA